MTTETPILNDHKQNCGSASAEGKRACIMPSASKFAAGKSTTTQLFNINLC